MGGRNAEAARFGAWRPALLLALAALTLRIAHLVWFSPYELIEDEAHYWEWSRRLDLSYYTKGPGVAWCIALTTRLLGDTELAVRLPAAFASAVGMLAVAGLTRAMGGGRRAMLWAAALWALVPMHLALGLLMTIDGPYLACWALCAWAGWIAIGKRSGPALVLCGFVLGVGCLFKYTILFLAAGLALARVLHRDADVAGDVRRRSVAGRVGWLFGALGAFALAASPIIIWNARRGWPTVRHLLEHLHAKSASAAPGAGDAGGWSYDPMWTIGFLGAQAAIGPALGLVALAVIRSWRTRRLAEPSLVTGCAPPPWPVARCLICCAAPVMLFYLALSFVTQPEGNWPLAGYTTLLVLVGLHMPARMDACLARVAKWFTSPADAAGRRPRWGMFRRKPETAWQVLAHWSIGVGVVAALGIARLDLLARLPWIGPVIPMYRLSGARERAAEVRDMAASRVPVFIVAQHYGPASQTAFYWPRTRGAKPPVIYCARGVMGGQPSQYDFFPDTRLDDPAMFGHRAVALGGDAAFWAPAFERVEDKGNLERRDAARAARGRIPKYSVFFCDGYHGWPTAPPAPTAAPGREAGPADHGR